MAHPRIYLLQPEEQSSSEYYLMPSGQGFNIFYIIVLHVLQPNFLFVREAFIRNGNSLQQVLRSQGYRQRSSWVFFFMFAFKTRADNASCRLLLNPLQPRAPLAATSAAHPWVLGVPVPCWWSGTRCPGAPGLPSSWGRLCTRFMGPSQPVQNAMTVSEFDGEKGEGEQGREGGRARSRAGFARVLKGREAGDEVGKGKGSCAGKPDVPADGALGKTGREAREGGRAGAPQPSTRRGEANAGGAGPGGLLSAGGHGQVTIRRWEEADRAARKQIRGWLSPCSLCFPAKSHAPSCSILRLLAPSQHHPQHCRQIAAASVPPPRGRDSPLCSLTPGLLQSHGGEKEQSRACHEQHRVCPSLPSPKGFALCVGLGRISAPRSPKVVLGAQSPAWG